MKASAANAGGAAEASIGSTFAGPPPDEHAYGFSTLTLLSRSGARRRTLYLQTWRVARLAFECVDAPPRTIALTVDGWFRLPFADASIDCTVVDLDAAPEGQDMRRSVAAELSRISTRDADCLAVVSHRRRPRDPRAWSRYRFVPPVSRWRAAFRTTPLTEQRSVPLRFDGERLVLVQAGSTGTHPVDTNERTDAVALVLSSSPAGASTLEDVEASLAREIGGGSRVTRVHVRKIGKSAAFLTSAAGPVVLRLPRSPVALARAQRNYAALADLQSSGLDLQVDLVPRPLTHGVAGVQHYFVESAVPGVPREDAVSAARWDRQALAFISQLHVATARRTTLTESWFEAEVEPLIASIQAATPPSAHAVLGWLRRRLAEALVGRDVPLVRSHGDFTGGNCLYERGRLTGVVDWELSRAGGLPLLDLLQCVDLPAEYSPDGRWLRPEVMFDAAFARGPLAGSPQVRAYMTRMEMEPDLLRPLLLMHWLDHVGTRVAVRGANNRWFAGRVSAPLDRLGVLAATNDRIR